MTCWRRVLGNRNHGENTNSSFISGSNVLLSSWIDDHGRAECSSSRSKTPQLFWVLYERSVSSSISSSIPPLHDSSNWRCKETGRFVHPLTAVAQLRTTDRARPGNCRPLGASDLSYVASQARYIALRDLRTMDEDGCGRYGGRYGQRKQTLWSRSCIIQQLLLMLAFHTCPVTHHHLSDVSVE